MDFDGTIDLSLKAIKYDFKAQIDYADLHILNFYKSDSISILKGTIDFKADGNSIDDLAGILKLIMFCIKIVKIPTSLRIFK